jgi:hypothetical protein
VRAGLDLARHRHAGPRNVPAIDIHGRAVERDTLGIDELAALRLAGAVATP